MDAMEESTKRTPMKPDPRPLRKKMSQKRPSLTHPDTRSTKQKITQESETQNTKQNEEAKETENKIILRRSHRQIPIRGSDVRPLSGPGAVRTRKDQENQDTIQGPKRQK